MSIEELEKAVTKLTTEDRRRLLALLEELDAAEFDAAIERDALSGKLDRFAEESLADFRAGRFTEI